jgi:membrane protease YdiL (CAAX protease family)
LKDAARLLLYLVGVLLAGALLAPPLFWVGQHLITHRVLPSLARFDFESYFHRALLVAALLWLWPLFRVLRVRSWRDLGLDKNHRPGAELAAGFAIAAIPLLCCGAVLLAFPFYSLRHPFLWGKMPAVLGAAVVVPLLEEVLFRGFILGLLLRSCSRWGALLLTSAIFSMVHFLKPPRLTTPNDAVNWSSGFVSLGHSFWQFGDPLLVAAGFLTLFAVGCILADARLLTRSLWLPIGLHAGWIFANGLFSKAAHREMLALPWIGKDLLVGIVPLTIALASWGLMRSWVQHARAHPPQSISRTR